MKTKKKLRFISIALTFLMVVLLVMPASTTMSADQPMINLGTTSTFAVLAYSTITNTGTTVITGSAGTDIGLYPGTAFTGQASVTMNGGSIHLADTVATKAKDDLVTAYNDADSRLVVKRIPSELGGTTLTPGIYDSADGKFQITGTLTLDALSDSEGVFVFKTASTLTTATGSIVALTNNAQSSKTFWKVGSSATLGTNSTFMGHILAMASITAMTGAYIEGQLLARTGAVTLDNNIINNMISDLIVIPLPTVLPTPTAIPTVAPTRIPTPTPRPIATPTPRPIATPTPRPIATPTPRPIATPTPRPIATPTVAPIQPTQSAVSPTAIPEDNNTPEDAMPKTGAFPSEIFYGIGAILSGSGFYLWKKKK